MCIRYGRTRGGIDGLSSVCQTCIMGVVILMSKIYQHIHFPQFEAKDWFRMKFLWKLRILSDVYFLHVGLLDWQPTKSNTHYKSWLTLQCIINIDLRKEYEHQGFWNQCMHTNRILVDCWCISLFPTKLSPNWRKIHPSWWMWQANLPTGQWWLLHLWGFCLQFQL